MIKIEENENQYSLLRQYEKELRESYKIQEEIKEEINAKGNHLTHNKALIKKSLKEILNEI